MLIVDFKGGVKTLLMGGLKLLYGEGQRLFRGGVKPILRGGQNYFKGGVKKCLSNVFSIGFQYMWTSFRTRMLPYSGFKVCQCAEP